MAKAEVTRVLDAYADAIWRKDADALLALYAPDFCGFDMWGEWELDAAALKGSVAGWFGGLGVDERDMVTISDLRVTEGGDLMLAEAFVRFAATGPDGGEIRGIDNRFTWVLKKGASGWRILHQHSSAPLGDDASAQFVRPH